MRQRLPNNSRLITWGVLSFALWSLTTAAFAGPFLPQGEYNPDGEPRVFGDRVYLYGSHDRTNSKAFCDYLLKVWSAPLSDLTQWRDEGVSFATRNQPGHPSDVPWSTNELYAPDVIRKDGKYYLYAYVVGAPAAVGVSDSPAGPFKLLSKIIPPPGSSNEFGGWGGYPDPGVFVDDDGKVYIYWGYLRSYMAQLNPANMYEILPGTYQADIIPNTPPFNFFEAISPRKINGRYYLIYADKNILTYATSASPAGPFKYGGYIVRNGRDDPGGNIHGSLAQLNGQWYIFYHRMTNNTIFSRMACAEKVTIEPDGSIKEVEITSLGFRDALDPFSETSAHLACVIKGGNYISEAENRDMPIVRNMAGAVIGFRYFSFPPAGDHPATTFVAKIRPRPGHGRIEIWVDAIDNGTKLGELDLTADSLRATSRPGDPWLTVSTAVTPPPSGRRALFLRFVGENKGEIIADFNSFHFQ